MLEYLTDIDKIVFSSNNQGLSNPFFDFLMPILRNPYTWAPLYLFILIFAIKNYKKRGIIMILFFLLSFGLGDMISASVIKPQVMRVDRKSTRLNYSH